MIVVLCVSFVVSILLQDVLVIREHIATVFVFAVFLISLLTDGYVYGILTALIGVMAVNYDRTKTQIKRENRRFSTLDFLKYC